jgi:hypothetical protein
MHVCPRTAICVSACYMLYMCPRTAICVSAICVSSYYMCVCYIYVLILLHVCLLYVCSHTAICVSSAYLLEESQVFDAVFVLLYVLY